MRNLFLPILLSCLAPMAACGGEEGGGETLSPAATVFNQRIRFFQLVCTCGLPEDQQDEVVPPGSACVSQYVGGAATRTCIVDTVEGSWSQFRSEAECLRAAYEEAEDCVTRAPGCPVVGQCVNSANTAATACGATITEATSDCWPS